MWSPNSDSSVQFYIDSNGYLKCFYYYNNEANTSYVYSKADDADTKSEVLQHSVGKFASTLNALSPESQVSMVRFSRNEFSSNQLALLNWVNDTGKMTAAMNQNYGNALANGGAANTYLDGMTVYNYGFTGATHTYKGIEVFIDKMTHGAGQGYQPTATNGAPSKYLIIFTDGKDNSGNTQASVNYANSLKANGYTIMTVFMQSAGMTAGDISASEDFLKNLASNKPGGGKYFYSAMYNDTEALVRAFEEMASQVAHPLQNYTVKDYIDPRLDVIDRDGNVLTVLGDDGSYPPEGRTIFTAGGKQATLKYDSSKGMFYIEWTGQEIPTTTKNVTGQQKVSIWSSTITVRAKDDFLGGNNILSNGNEAGQNQVYDPNNPGNPKKDFPKTTVNPKVLDVHLSNYEDTIFKGENISPENLYDSVKNSRVQGDKDSKWFIEYLKRIGKKLKNNENYYINIISGQSYPTSDATVALDSVGKKLIIEVPYYYLEETGNEASYAGGALHKDDAVGTLKYTWTMEETGGNTLTDGDFRKDFTTIATGDVKYKLEVKYTPDTIDYGGDTIADNGTPRTLALTQQTGTDKLIRDPVGEEQTTAKFDKGIAVIHAVDGRIGIEKRMKKEELLSYLPEDGSVTFSFTINRKYNGSTEVYGNPVAITKTRTEIAGLTADSEGYVALGGEWIKDLPLGEYTITEAISDSEAMKLANIKVYESNDFVSDGSLVDFDAKKTAELTTEYSAPADRKDFAAAFSMETASVTWHIGEYKDGRPSKCSYSDTDFTEAVVTDGKKEVDPDKSENNEKNYLNAQLGKAIFKNKVTVGKVEIEKEDNYEHPLEGAVFTLQKTDDSWNGTGPVTELITTKADPVSGTSPAIALFDNLKPGKYIIKEKSAPSGYVPVPATVIWRVTVDADGNISVEETGSSEPVSVISGSGQSIKIKVENRVLYQLPDAGGIGTDIFNIVGAFMIVISILLYFNHRTGEVYNKHR